MTQKREDCCAGLRVLAFALAFSFLMLPILSANCLASNTKIYVHVYNYSDVQIEGTFQVNGIVENSFQLKPGKGTYVLEDRFYSGGIKEIRIFFARSNPQGETVTASSDSIDASTFEVVTVRYNDDNTVSIEGSGDRFVSNISALYYIGGLAAIVLFLYVLYIAQKDNQRRIIKRIAQKYYQEGLIKRIAHKNYKEKKTQTVRQPRPGSPSTPPAEEAPAQELICPECNTERDGTETFCKRCGTKLE